jgi:hypothetical protein
VEQLYNLKQGCKGDIPARNRAAAPGKTKKISTYKRPWKRLFIKK